MSHLNGSGSAHVYDRWMRIQQKDVMHELNHLQNHLGTMRDSLLCFRSTVYTLNIDDVALLHIKNAVKKVTQSMDEMRFCFKHVGRNLGSIGDKDSQGASCVRTENNHGTTSQIHFPYGLPPDYDSTLIRDILPPSDQRVPVQQTSGIPSTPIDNWQLRDRQTHVTEEAKSQTVSLVTDKAEASADSLVTSNERSEADTESDHFAQPAATQEEHFEETLEYPGSSYDHVLESTYQTPDLVPEDAPQLIYDQTADGCDEPAEIFAHVPGGTSVAASACEASGYVVDLNLDVTGDAQESALPLYSEVVAYEEHRLYDQAERLDSDQTTEVSHPGPPLDETFVSAIQASHPRSDTSAAEAAQSNDDHDVELDLVPVHTGNETILEETARVSVPDSEAYEGQTVSFELDPDVDPLEVQIVTEEHSGDATKLDDALERVRTDQLSVSVAEASDSQMPLQTQRYRNGRESPECENGSLDGFLSPLPNEARPSCDSNVPPDYCDIDGLTESLEKFWSLGEKSPIISGRSPPVQSLPKSGKIPRTIEEFRLPPPLKYVPTIISSCADDGLYVQLMADEGAILGFDGLIIKGSRGAPLKFAEVQPGDFVLCMYDLDNRFYRAQLLKAAGDDKFEVRFVDYGNSCIASVKNMRQIPAGCRRFGQHALKCEFSEELKTNAEEIKRQLELVSLDAYFLACFAPNYVDRDREPPIFTLIDMQKIDGTGILRVPPPSSLESLNAQFVVRNLELGSLGTAKLDLVEDLERKKAIAEMLRTSPKLPCKRDCVKEGSLVAYKCQRARVAKRESNTRLSLELIDEFQNILTDIPLAECSYLPLAAVNIPPTASCVVRVDKFQDMEMLNELCLSGSDIQMTVVGVDVLPLAKFSRIENGLSGGLEVAGTKLE